MRELVVLDPGHGGGGGSGSSTPGGVRGPGGTAEKDLTLALARLVSDELAARRLPARLTRGHDDNPSLGERIAVARAAGASAFVSLHFNASPDPEARGAEVWVHDGAGPRARALADALRGALGGEDGAEGPGASLREGALAVLDPSWHAPGTPACLIELAYLTSPDEERRLADRGHRARLAGAVAGGIAGFLAAAPTPSLKVERRESSSFDIWHEVPLVPQLTGMSCWAAAAAMVVGWRDCIDVRPEEVAQGAGAWEEYRDGLEPRNVDALARTFGLVVELPSSYTVDAVRRLLERYGPLWVGAGPTGLHVVVVSGMHSDGTVDGTFLRVLDPWPLGRGERYTISLRELAANLDAATDASGVQASILHCGDVARGNGARRIEVRRSWQAQARLAGGGERSAPRYGTPLALFRLYNRDNPPATRGAGAAARAAGTAPADERDWYPADARALAQLPPPPLDAVERARYADDADSPDLRHLGHAGGGAAFALTERHLGRLAALNRFPLSAPPRVVLFGLRGCRLVDPGAAGTWSASLSLDEDIPDHRTFRCVLGVWRPADGALIAVAGSTVPNRRWMQAQLAAGSAAAVSNLLPMGFYRYRLGDHRFVPGVFVIQPRIVVRRALADLVFTVRDLCEEASPADNIHPAFHDADMQFSSAGCQTIPGSYDASAGHTGPWARFRQAALEAIGGDGGDGFGYLLLTGREARLASEDAPDGALARLRFGSSGPDVAALQRALARQGAREGAGPEPGRFDAATALAFMDLQRRRDGGAADGIVTPDEARRLGFELPGVRAAR
jgi:N-acetylmuramoyl-L-alanine amidase